MVGRKLRSTFQRTLAGDSDANVHFGELIAMLRALGFAERIRGDHHVLWKEGIAEIINLQPRGSKAKPYQVRQVRRILVQYALRLDDE